MNEILPVPWKVTEEPGRLDQKVVRQVEGEILENKDLDYFDNKFIEEKSIFFGNDLILDEAKKAFKDFSNQIRDRKIVDQSYALLVRPDGIAVSFEGLPGLLNGFSTLKQLRGSDGSFPCITILDRPALAYRGFLQDLSRGQVLWLEGLKRLVEILAEFRYNFLTFNIEHTFSFESHPQIGAGHDPLTKDELKELIQFSKTKGIEIIPSQQSLGHLRGILSLPKYRHLAYDENLCWSINPSKEESYKLLRDLYEEVIPCHESGFFNVCCDEPFDIGKSFDAARFKGRSFAQVYFDHLMRLKDILDAHGKRMMVWGDMLLSHPEILSWLPKDVIVLNWQYGSGLREGPEYYREKIKPISEAGLEFMTCTCTWNLTKVFTNLEMAEANNRNFIQEGIKAGAMGNLVTNWGDMCHMNLLGLQAWPIAYAAQLMWAGMELEPQEFDKAFSECFFQDKTGRAGALMRKLQEANNILAHPMFGDIAFQVFFDETFAGDFMLMYTGRENMAEELFRVTEQAMSLLDELLSAPAARLEWLDDLLFPIQQFHIISEKIKIFTQAESESTTHDGLSRISKEFQRLAEKTHEAARLLEQRWLSQAKRSDLHVNLDRLGRLCEAYTKRSKQFKELAERLEKGQPLPEWKDIARKEELIPYKLDLIREMGLKDLL
jgi:hypothetical protein